MEPAPEDTYAISPLTGQFADPVQEAAYRRDTVHELVRQLRHVAVIGGLFFLAGSGVDYLVVGWGPALCWLLLIRVAAAVLLGWLAFRIEPGLGHQEVDRMSFLALLSCSAATCLIIALSPLSLIQHSLTVFVFITVYYLFVPGRLLFSAASAVSFCLAFMLVGRVYLTYTPSAYLVVAMYLTLANILGGMTTQRLNRLRRLHYAKLQAERQAHEALRQEMSERLKAEKVARESEERFRRLVELSPDAILVHRQGCILYVNAAARFLFGVEEGVPLDHEDILDYVHPDYHQLVKERLATLYSGAQRLASVDLILVDSHGRTIQAEVVSGATSFGGQRAVQSIIRDVSDRKSMEKKLRDMAYMDPLTGVHNRRSYVDLSQVEMDRARRYSRLFSVMILDIDGFKGVNDRHGHAAGDLVLRQVSDTCKRLLRKQDILGRLGGDEFALTMPETGSEAALAVAARLREAVAGLEMVWEGAPIRCTVSVGVAEFVSQDQDLGDCLRRADTALYTAKQAGRNRVALA